MKTTRQFEVRCESALIAENVWNWLKESWSDEVKLDRRSDPLVVRFAAPAAMTAVMQEIFSTADFEGPFSVFIDGEGVQPLNGPTSESSGASRLEAMIDELVKSNRAERRNKVFVEFEILLLSASVELGKDAKAKDLTRVIEKYLSGSMSPKDEALYDAAVAACGLTASRCFGTKRSPDVDYSISWVQDSVGRYCAEIRPA